MSGPEGLSRRDTLLSGMAGIVYLLLLGREASVSELHAGAFDRLQVEALRIDEAVNSLRSFDDAFLIRRRPQQASRARVTGRTANVYTGNFTPLLATLRACELEFNPVDMIALITDLSSASGAYPAYLRTQFNLDGPGGFLHLTFRTLLAHFFLYLSQVLSGVKFANFPEIAIDQRTVDAVRSRLPDVPIRMTEMALQLLRYDGTMTGA